RLILLNAGVLTVVVGVPGRHWPAIVAGASAVAFAVGWQAAGLALRLRASLRSRFAVTVGYYVTAGVLLLVGVLFGVLMSHGVSTSWHERMTTAHVLVNVLGWVGLTVLGTLVTLWPTMLRTRIAD